MEGKWNYDISGSSNYPIITYSVEKDTDILLLLNMLKECMKYINKMKDTKLRERIAKQLIEVLKCSTEDN